MELNEAVTVCKEWHKIISSYKELSIKRFLPDLYLRPIRHRLVIGGPFCVARSSILLGICKGNMDNTFFVTDYDLGKIQLFDSRGVPISNVTGEGIAQLYKPLGICTKDSQLFVCCDGGILRIDKNYKFLEFIDTSAIASRPYYIAVSDTCIFISAQSQLFILDRKGSLIKKIDIPNDTDHIMVGVCCNSHQQVIVCNVGEKKIQTFGSDGLLVREFPIGDEITPCSLCVDCCDNILIGHTKNWGVSIFNPIGRLISRFIFNQVIGHPSNYAYPPQVCLVGQEYIVTCGYDSNQIRIYSN